MVCFASGERERFVVARHEERGWELPGGTVEAGESALEAASREFREEIGHALEEPGVVLETTTPEGLCTVVRGVLGAKVGVGEAAIEEWRLVTSLSRVEPLAWPEDPYREIEEALGTRIR